MRDRTIDGFRAVAALGVVFDHAVLYRFGDAGWLHYAQRIAGPLAQTSVQLFFVISGYIITTLLLKEKSANGTLSLTGFYLRRVCRIIPPLVVFLVVAAVFRLADPLSLAMASTFTCNIGECSWAVAHTWSLSVEEQFYLVWPVMLLTAIGRPRYLILGISLLLLAFLFAPFAWHSNYISFVCIGLGALYAYHPKGLRVSTLAWCGAGAFLILSPLYLPLKAGQILTPFAIVYLLFGAPQWAKQLLAHPAVQMIGLASYSLYLWQQLFFGAGSTLPLVLLPLAVAASVVLVEQPFIKLGRRLSSAAPLARSWART